MTTMNANASDSLAKALAAIDALRKTGDSLLAKVASDIADLNERLARVEASTVESARTAPLHLRKG